MTKTGGSSHPRLVTRWLFRHCVKKGLCIDNHPVNVILRPPKDLAVPTFVM